MGPEYAPKFSGESAKTSIVAPGMEARYIWRNPAPVDRWQTSHDLKGFNHPVPCRISKKKYRSISFKILPHVVTRYIYYHLLGSSRSEIPRNTKYVQSTATHVAPCWCWMTGAGADMGTKSCSDWISTLDGHQNMDPQQKNNVDFSGHIVIRLWSFWWENKPLAKVYNWLVVWTPLKNISQLGWLFPIYGKIQNVPNHQPDNCEQIL